MDLLLCTTKNKMYYIVLRNSVSKGMLRVTGSNKNMVHISARLCVRGEHSTTSRLLRNDRK